MSQVGSRKRAAPGASPMAQHQPQIPGNHNLGRSPQLSSDQYLQWNQHNPTNGTSSYPDPTSSFSPNLYNGMTQPQGTPAASSNQLARRPLGQHLVTRGDFNNVVNGPWPTIADDTQPPVSDAWPNDNDDLDQKALVAKRDTEAERKHIPPFVQKLSSFLDESRNTDLIRWSDSGDSFIVLDEDEFAKTLIPELFKHNKYASFVRQLNMYGFHKKVGLSDNSMRASERKNKSPSEYYNPYFKRGRPNLLWLIQKPKNVQGKGSGKGGTRVKQEDGNLDDDGDEIYETDSPAPPKQGPIEPNTNLRSSRQPLMISSAAGALPQEHLSTVQRELQAVRQQQAIISGIIKKMRQEHEQQAAQFQNLHDRHESSINAILTFLATVYNRSLEGNAGQNIADMFAIPNMAQSQGNVVDVGDYGNQDASISNSQVQRHFRKQPLLLKAPPPNRQNGRVMPVSPAASVNSPLQRPQTRPSTGQAQHNSYASNQSHAHSPAIQELFDTTSSNRSSQSPQVMANNDAGGQIPETDIMSIINSANANNINFPNTRMEFPEALTHLETADGNLPLTPSQRREVLQLMASGSTGAGQNGDGAALTSPSPPNVPRSTHYDATNHAFDFLDRNIQEQNSRVANIEKLLAPLSPSGSIPGLNDGQSYNGSIGTEVLDLDQIFNSGEYFNDSSNGGLVDFGHPPLGNGGDPNGGFDLDAMNGNDSGFDGLEDVNGQDEHRLGGRILETADSSEVTSPANTAEEGGVGGGIEEGRSPRKRRRRN